MRSLILFMLCATTACAQDSASLFKTHCSSCHDAGIARVPPTSALKAMFRSTIRQTLESGPMKTQGAALTGAERDAVINFLGVPDKAAAAAPPPTAFCKVQKPFAAAKPSKAEWQGWGADLSNSRYADAATAGITGADVPKLKLKWAFGLGEGTNVRSQVVVGAGHLFVANLTGQLYSLDASTGCIQWAFDAGQPVHSSLMFGALDPAGKQSAVYFGDTSANVYGVDASSGKLLWKVQLDTHPAARITAAPILHEGMLFVSVSSLEEVSAGSPTYECCTFRGSIVALNPATGKTIWQTYTISEPPQPTTKSDTGIQKRGPSGGAVWSSPTFDEKTGTLYIATGDNYSFPATSTSDSVLALDAETGKILWVKQITSGDVFNLGPEITGSGPDFDFGQPPILVSLPNGHRALVIGQKSGVAFGLDPDAQGKLLWQTRLGKGGALGGMEWGSAADGQNMYAAVSDLTLTSVPDPSSRTGSRYITNANIGGGLYALDLGTGEKRWSAMPASCSDRPKCSPAQSAAVTAIAGAVFSGSEDGHLRAYSATDGKVIWDVDSAREYQTVNGAAANGGSMNGAGPVISHGILYVNSGDGLWGGVPGNVLLAFSVDGR
jgi:polyvinyl alcohol dehydrogenase (cytochrome)